MKVLQIQSFILDVLQGSEYASEYDFQNNQNKKIIVESWCIEDLNLL